MQGELKVKVVETMEHLRIQKKVLGAKLEAAVLKGAPAAIRKTAFDLKQAEKGESRILDLYA